MGFENGYANDRPKGALPNFSLFELKDHGFSDADGVFYPLEEGEELVGIKEPGQAERTPYIRKNGQDIPFEIWKQDK